MSKEKIFKVTFMNQGKVYELHAREVVQSGLFGFIELGDFVFGESATIVIDPSEEKLRSEFENVRSTVNKITANRNRSTETPDANNADPLLSETDDFLNPQPSWEVIGNWGRDYRSHPSTSQLHRTQAIYPLRFRVSTRPGN